MATAIDMEGDGSYSGFAFPHLTSVLHSLVAVLKSGRGSMDA